MAPLTDACPSVTKRGAAIQFCCDSLARAGIAVVLSGASVQFGLPAIRCTGITIGEGNVAVPPRAVTSLGAGITISECCLPVAFGVVTLGRTGIPIPRSILAVGRRVCSGDAGSFDDGRCRYTARRVGPFGGPVPQVRNVVAFGGGVIARFGGVIALVT